jgi:hypothetical protein
MKKNLLDKDAVERMISRVQGLQPSTQPLWGSMTSTEMLLHCNRTHQHLLSPSVSTKNKTSLKQYVIRWVVLYLMPRFPKGAKTPKPLRTKGTISDAAFTEQKHLFIQLLRRFPTHNSPITHPHPYFGGLTTKQWGLSAWKHADHHLRQFGV